MVRAANETLNLEDRPVRS